MAPATEQRLTSTQFLVEQAALSYAIAAMYTCSLSVFDKVLAMNSKQLETARDISSVVQQLCWSESGTAAQSCTLRCHASLQAIASQDNPSQLQDLGSLRSLHGSRASKPRLRLDDLAG